MVLPTAMIAVMGPEAAVNAVYYNKIMAMPEEERAATIQSLREEYRSDVDIFKLASELIVDAVVNPGELRDELIDRYSAYESKELRQHRRKHGVMPE
jgi:acetyl-CoA carboxylase carboxyltransferase component